MLKRVQLQIGGLPDHHGGTNKAFENKTLVQRMVAHSSRARQQSRVGHILRWRISYVAQYRKKIVAACKIKIRTVLPWWDRGST